VQSQDLNSARTFINKAGTAYSQGDYSQAIDNCDSARFYLGENHEFIFYFKIGSLYGLKKYLEASLLLNEYKKFTKVNLIEPSPSILVFESIIERDSRMETRRYEECVLNKNTDSIETFLEIYPFSEYKENLLNLLDELYLESNIINVDIDNISRFLTKYPNRDYVDSLFVLVKDDVSKIHLAWTYLQNCNDCKFSLSFNDYITEYDYNLYQQCSTLNTQKALIIYLDNSIPNGGLYRDQVEILLQKRKEFDDYSLAITGNSIDGFVYFLNKHKMGVHYYDVLEKLNSIIFSTITSEFDKTHYNTVIQLVDIFYSYNFEQVPYLDDFREKAFKYISRKDEWSLMYHRDRTSQYSFGMSKSNVSSRRLPGFYWNFRFNENYFNYDFSPKSDYDLNFWRNNTAPMWSNDWLIDDDLGTIAFKGLSNMIDIDSRTDGFIFSGNTFSIGTIFALSKHPKPIWLYIGGGIGSYLRFYQFQTISYTTYPPVFDKIWVLDRDFSYSRVLTGEFGLKFTVLKNIALEGGVAIKDHSLVPTFGIGISFSEMTPYDWYYQ
jgi:hypothetical protein